MSSTYDFPSDGGPVQNTDRHLWPQTSENERSPTLFATAGGGIGINVGGHVIVKPLQDWHALARQAASHGSAGGEIDIEHAFIEVCDELGCAYDNESPLIEIANLRQRAGLPRSEVQSREAIAAIIDPVAFDPISLGDTHPGWLHRRETALETADKIRALGAAQAASEPTPKAMLEAFNDWSYYKKEGEPVGRMLAHEAARVSFVAGAKWALTLPSADGGGE